MIMILLWVEMSEFSNLKSQLWQDIFCYLPRSLAAHKKIYEFFWKYELTVSQMLTVNMTLKSDILVYDRLIQAQAVSQVNCIV